MMNDDEQNFNEEISLQNYKHDDSIDLDGVNRQFDEYDENKLLFWIICNILSLLNLSNLNVYVINTCYFDLFS